MTRYWFKFEVPFNTSLPPGIRIGCGVTANDYSEAIELLRQLVFKSSDIPKHQFEANVDVSKLDAGHVLPNMGSPSFKGVWFPQGYQ